MKTNMNYWEDTLHNLPESYKKRFEEEKKYLLDVLTTDATVLEVWCGDGRSIFDMVPKTHNITWIDHDMVAINKAKEKFSDNKKISLIYADATAIPFSNDTFDFVVCMTTFANFADKKIAILKEMKRVLKHWGKIILSVFSEDALEERMKLYKDVGVKIDHVDNGKVVFDKNLWAHISEQFSREELIDIFKQVHLHVTGIQKVDIAYLCTVEKNT